MEVFAEFGDHVEKQPPLVTLIDTGEEKGREGRREGGEREGGKEGRREGGEREGGREKEREGRNKDREGGRRKGREKEREGGYGTL